MQVDKNVILFSFVFRGKEYAMQAARDQYPSLMVLIADRFPVSGFGICCGAGSCGTCGVEVGERCTAARQFVLSCETKIDAELSDKKVYI